MTSDLDEGIITALRQLYETDENAQRFLDLNAGRERAATSTSIDVICRKLDVTRGEAVALAKELERTGCGEFKNGRRGSKSRFTWSYNCISVGKSAAGETVALERTDVLDFSDFEEEDDSDEVDAKQTLNVGEMIADAKRELAAKIGLSVSQIEIQIKA